jgi:hypothetical protein
MDPEGESVNQLLNHPLCQDPFLKVYRSDPLWATLTTATRKISSPRVIRLACVLLRLPAFSVSCNKTVVTALIITSTISGTATGDPATGIDPYQR